MSLPVEDPFMEINRLLDEKATTSKHEEKCKHTETITEGTNSICSDCGEVLDKDVNYDKEWRYYGMMDTKHSSDPNRCNIRKNEDKTIYKDVEKMGFSDRIITVANQLYEQVTQGNIYRGNTRKGIIFACIFHAYKLNQNPQSCEILIDIFGIDRKIGLRGLKFVNLNAPKDSNFRNYQITTEHLIKEIMTKFHANDAHIDEALIMYSIIKDKSSILNRSRPQSVASGLVRYYIQKKNPDISMDYFRTKINLSELTITRIVKEIKSLLEDN
jgi:transcription initiation factor TFIIIB Brf1 subunit/transcription initiation factor TFIIB